MSNPFLRLVNYSPGDVPPADGVAGQSAGASVGPAAAVMVPAVAAPQTVSPMAAQAASNASWTKGFGRTAAAAMFIVGVACSDLLENMVRATWAFTKGKMLHAPVIMTTNSHELAAVEVERYTNLSAALDANPVVMSRIVENLNRPEYSRFEIIPPGGVPGIHGVYALRPRPGFEDEFGEFGPQGLDRLRLYEVHVPSNWSAGELEDKKIVWAHKCKVSPELIDLWSEFVPRRGIRRVNECRPGGRCLIVTKQCGTLVETNVEV